MTLDQRDGVGHFTSAAVTTAAPIMTALRLGHGSSRAMRQGAVRGSATSITAARAGAARGAPGSPRGSAGLAVPRGDGLGTQGMGGRGAFLCVSGCPRPLEPMDLRRVGDGGD